MQRFFFNTQDGESIADVEGVELPDVAAARIEAVRLLGELLREHAEDFWNTRTFSITVTDEQGIAVLVLMTAGTHMQVRHKATETIGG